MYALLGRGLLVLVLCLTTAGALWGVLLLAGVGGWQTGVPFPVAGASARLAAPLPPVSQLRLDPTTAQAAIPALPAGPPPTAQPTPLDVWAGTTARLVGVPEAELIAYAVADLAMQDRAPQCGLSWITVAAVGRVVGTAQLGQPDRRVQEAVTMAETMCASGRDITTEAGWESAVRSVGAGRGTAYVHQVLAAATVYATAVQSGIPISPPAQVAIDFAIDQIGLPYVWGGDGPERGEPGFDCSGLTKAAYAAAGIEVPRTAHTQYFATRHLAADELPQPGDLLFYGHPSTKIYHVGLYIGNGQMINAPTFGMPVQVTSYRSGHFAGAGRPAG